MQSQEGLRAELSAAVSGAGTALAAADRLCLACVDLLEVDGASISLVHQGASRGTFGSSGELSRALDEMQFTLGEGPCLDSVEAGRAVLVPDLDRAGEVRWPALRGALLEHGIGAVFAMPVMIARTAVGALDLFRERPGPLTEQGLTAGLWAAELAALPLLDLMSADLPPADGDAGGEGWDQLASLERVEVYQATGMVMAALDVGPAEALVRLRAYAFSHARSASEVAWAFVERRLVPDHGEWQERPADGEGGH